MSSADDQHKRPGTSGSGTSGTPSGSTVSPPAGDPSSGQYPNGTSGTTTSGSSDLQQPPIQTTQPSQGGTVYDTGSSYPTSTTTTTAADYDYQTAADTEARETRPNRPMLITGGGLFLAGYVPSVIVAAASDQDADKRLYIPVVGPWLDMGQRECSFGDCGTREDINNVLLIGSGVAQGVGVGLAVASLFVPENRERSAKGKAPAVAHKPEVKVTPISLRGGGGIGAVGTF